MEPEDVLARQQFLMNMYDQMWNNTTRHITLIWQPIIVIFATIGAIMAAEIKDLNFVAISIFISLAFLIIGWYLAHVHDSSGWVNRNLVIISNIEKQFLVVSDETEIHPYFNSDPKKREMIEHFQIQYFLGLTLGFAVTIYYIWKIIQNNLGFVNEIIIPIAGFIIASAYVLIIRTRVRTKFEDLVKVSTGKMIC
jgi:hypothetical protein